MKMHKALGKTTTQGKRRNPASKATAEDSITALAKALGVQSLQKASPTGKRPKHCKDCVLVRIVRKDGVVQRYWVSYRDLMAIQESLQQHREQERRRRRARAMGQDVPKPTGELASIVDVQVELDKERTIQIVSGLQEHPTLGLFQFPKLREMIDSRFKEEWVRDVFLLLGTIEPQHAETEDGLAQFGVQVFSAPGIGKTTLFEELMEGLAQLESPYEVVFIPMTHVLTVYDLLGLPITATVPINPDEDSRVTLTALKEAVAEAIARAKQNGRSLLFVLDDFGYAPSPVMNAMASILAAPTTLPELCGMKVSFVALSHPSIALMTDDEIMRAIGDRLLNYTAFLNESGERGVKVRRAKDSIQSASFAGTGGWQLLEKARQRIAETEQEEDILAMPSPESLPLRAMIPHVSPEVNTQPITPDTPLPDVLTLAQLHNYQIFFELLTQFVETNEDARRAKAYTQSDPQVRVRPFTESPEGNAESFLSKRRISMVAASLARLYALGYDIDSPVVYRILRNILGSAYVSQTQTVDLVFPLVTFLKERMRTSVISDVRQSL